MTDVKDGLIGGGCCLGIIIVGILLLGGGDEDTKLDGNYSSYVKLSNLHLASEETLYKECNKYNTNESEFVDIGISGDHTITKNIPDDKSISIWFMLFFTDGTYEGPFIEYTTQGEYSEVNETSDFLSAYSRGMIKNRSIDYVEFYASNMLGEDMELIETFKMP